MSPADETYAAADFSYTIEQRFSVHLLNDFAETEPFQHRGQQIANIENRLSTLR
jgi:hypothetical protein